MMSPRPSTITAYVPSATARCARHASARDTISWPAPGVGAGLLTKLEKRRGGMGRLKVQGRHGLFSKRVRRRKREAACRAPAWRRETAGARPAGPAAAALLTRRRRDPGLERRQHANLLLAEAQLAVEEVDVAAGGTQAAQHAQRFGGRAGLEGTLALPATRRSHRTATCAAAAETPPQASAARQQRAHGRKNTAPTL